MKTASGFLLLALLRTVICFPLSTHHKSRELQEESSDELEVVSERECALGK